MSSPIEDSYSKRWDLALGKVPCMFLSPSSEIWSGVGKIDLSNSCKGFKFLGFKRCFTMFSVKYFHQFLSEPSISVFICMIR